MLLTILGMLLSLSANASQTKIAVVDTGLDINDQRFTSVLCPFGHKDFTGTGLADTNGHGTHVTGLIMQYAKNANYCIVVVKYYDEHRTNRDNEYFTIQALEYAASQNVQFINFSSGGKEESKGEKLTILQNPEVTYVVAAGNNGEDLDNPNTPNFPSCYHLYNIVVVGNAVNGIKAPSSNYGSVVNVWEDGQSVLSTLPGGFYGRMTGTSMSAAIHSGKMIYELHR